MLGRLWIAVALLPACTSVAPELEQSSTLPNFEGRVSFVSDAASATSITLDSVRTDTGGLTPRIIVVVSSPLNGPTVIEWADGRSASTSDIAAGQEIKVWAVGGTRSLPPQMYADRIVLPTP